MNGKFLNYQLSQLLNITKFRTLKVKIKKKKHKTQQPPLLSPTLSFHANANLTCNISSKQHYTDDTEFMRDVLYLIK